MNNIDRQRSATSSTGTNNVAPDPYRFLHWAMLFSPLRDDDLAADAWETLQLPGDFSAIATDFNRCFVLDYPAPKASPIFSALLQREAGACREEWMRIAAHLDLARTGPSLPPDHLALACEIIAHAITRNEQVLLQGILERYVMPWIRAAQEACEDPLMQDLLQHFQHDADLLREAQHAA